MNYLEMQNQSDIKPGDTVYLHALPKNINTIQHGWIDSEKNPRHILDIFKINCIYFVTELNEHGVYITNTHDKICVPFFFLTSICSKFDTNIFKPFTKLLVWNSQKREVELKLHKRIHILNTKYRLGYACETIDNSIYELFIKYDENNSEHTSVLLNIHYRTPSVFITECAGITNAGIDYLRKGIL